MRKMAGTLPISVAVVFLLVGCADSSPPTWPDGAELTVKDVLANSATLDWPPALDDSAVAGYRIFKGQAAIAEVGAGEAYHEIKELEEAVEHKYSIEAFDAAGNVSSRLELTFRTQDGSPPTWPEGAELKAEKRPLEATSEDAEQSAEQPQKFQLVLSWPAASDNVEVTEYRVKKGTAVIGELQASERRFSTETATPDGLYRVEAGDAAGNWTPGPTATVGDLSSALEQILPDTGVLKLLGGPTGIWAADLDENKVKATVDALLSDRQGLDASGGSSPLGIAGGGGLGSHGVAPGSLIGKDSKLTAPSGDLTLDLLDGGTAPLHKQ